MVDLGFLGQRYTWTNKRGISGLIQECIDRFFVTPNWWHLYPEAQVTHLTRRHFDHCPIVLDSNPRRSMQRPRPFVFQSFWLSDTSFPGVVPSCWQAGSSLAKAIENFAKKTTTWNKTHFENVFAKKRRILARLNGVQRAITISPTSFLLQLESNLQCMSYEPLILRLTRLFRGIAIPCSFICPPLSEGKETES